MSATPEFGAQESRSAESGSATFTPVSRILHWLTAILVFSALFVGFVMVNSVGDYATLLLIHKTIGATVLVVVVIRVINRVTHRPPALPPTVGRVERQMVVCSELTMYVLLLAQPLIGWAMVSAVGAPVVVFAALRLPPIAPVDVTVFSALREAHSVVAWLLVAVVAVHVCAVLLHSITLGDGMLSRMTIARNRLPAGTASPDNS